MSDDYDPPLVHLPGTPLTPEVVLHRTLNKIARIKSVIVIMTWDDDSVSTDHSLQSAADMVFGAKILECEINRIVFDGEGRYVQRKSGA